MVCGCKAGEPLVYVGLEVIMGLNSTEGWRYAPFNIAVKAPVEGEFTAQTKRLVEGFFGWLRGIRGSEVTMLEGADSSKFGEGTIAYVVNGKPVASGKYALIELGLDVAELPKILYSGI